MGIHGEEGQRFFFFLMMKMMMSSVFRKFSLSTKAFF